VPSHLRVEIDELKKKLLNLSGVVEASVQKAVQAVDQKNEVLGENVISQDPVIDMQEVSVEEECLKILALHQPVAVDLRFIVSVLKINNDLERIGDLACNIAERAIFLSDYPNTELPFDFEAMSQTTRWMLKKSLDSLIQFDAKTAEAVCREDQKVDDIHRKTYKIISEKIRANPELTDFYIQCLSISRNLERIADYTTNIAEDVIYLIEGKIVRHFGDLYEKSSPKATN
jgi:phosphate transport system protein